MFIAISQLLPCYPEQRGLTILMVNYVLSSIVVNLMVHNMTKKPFSVLQPTLLLLLVPFAFHFAQVGPQVESMVTVGVTIVAFMIFMTKMSVLSAQWCQYAGKPFWVVPAQTPAAKVEDKTK